MKNLHRSISIIAAAFTLVCNAMPQAAAAPGSTKVAKQPAARSAASGYSVPDELLVMASGSADSEDIASSVQEVNGTIVRTIGEGVRTVYVVRTEKGKLADTEAKLKKDSDVALVQRNFLFKPQEIAPKAYVSDPFFSAQWNLSALQVPSAWIKAKGEGQILAIVDTGNPTVTRDLRTYAGFNTDKMTAGQKPFGDHGTLVATTAGAKTNNKLNTAAVAPSIRIFPIRVCDDRGYITEAAITEAIYQCGKRGIKLVNMSLNDTPPYSLSNKNYHPVFHIYADWFHNEKNGLLFVSAGNDGMQDMQLRSPSIIVVNSVNAKLQRAAWSNYGHNVWFTAPGEGIYCSDSQGRVVSVSGSSFSAPSVAAIAALVWSERPALKNVDVEQILIATTKKLDRLNYVNQYYGYGMPQAAAAVEVARIWKVTQ